MKRKETRACTRDSISKLASCKRSQEEMVGFVLIIILVSIISLVFLGISISKRTVSQSDAEIENFLQAISEITTDCAVNYEANYLNVNELIKSCLNEERCLNGKQSCESLNKTLSESIEKSWVFCPECSREGYEFTLSYQNNTFYTLKYGECKASKTGDWSMIRYAEDNIITNLEICYQVKS